MSHTRRIPQGLFFHSLKWNFVLLGGLGIVAISVLGLVLSLISRSVLLDAERSQLMECSNLIIHGLDSATPQTLSQEQVKSITGQTSYRITIIALDGAVLADSEANPRYMENHASRPEVMGALRGKSDFHIRYSHTLNQDMLYLAQPWKGAILRVAMPLQAVSNLVGTFFNGMLVVLGSATLVMALVSWRMYRGIIIPINRILDSTEAKQFNGFNAQYHVSRPLELAAISRSLYQMTIDLNHQIAETTQHSQELRRLFEAIREPVMLLDHNQVIQTANAAALAFLRELEESGPESDGLTESDIIGRHLLTYIRCSDLAKLIQESDSGQTAISRTVWLYGLRAGELGAYVAPIESSDPEQGRLSILVLYPDKPIR